MKSQPPRDSLTHPLVIDELATPGGGRMGLTICPGKHQLDAASGSWERDLDADMDVVQAWGAGTLVCLLENHELRALRAERLPDACRERGVVFRHLPIPDYHPPDATFEDLWLYHGAALRRALLGGGRVLLHCKGGLGRTGTVAARLLVEMGVAPAQAMQEVRAARHGCVENHEQETHVLACRPPRVEHERVLGSLLGGAVGDAFGYTVEFLHLDDIRARYGAGGLREPQPVGGRLIVSDDTQMTLFTLEGMARALRENPDAGVADVVARVRLAYFDWLRTQRADTEAVAPTTDGSLVNEPLLHAGRAPGNTCLTALVAGGDGSVATPLNDSKGCGGIMRVAPLGFVPRRFDTASAATLGLRAAALTHGHASGYLAAAVMSAAVCELIAGAPMPRALDSAAACIADEDGAGETLAALAAARAAADAASADHAPAIAELGEGWVAEEALAIGVYAALAGADFADVLAIAVNHDGDSDSTASIAGQLYGACRGLDGLPNDWVVAVDVLAPLLRTLGALWSADRDG